MNAKGAALGETTQHARDGVSIVLAQAHFPPETVEQWVEAAVNWSLRLSLSLHLLQKTFQERAALNRGSQGHSQGGGAGVLLGEGLLIRIEPHAHERPGGSLPAQDAAYLSPVQQYVVRPLHGGLQTRALRNCLRDSQTDPKGQGGHRDGMTENHGQQQRLPRWRRPATIVLPTLACTLVVAYHYRAVGRSLEQKLPGINHGGFRLSAVHNVRAGKGIRYVCRKALARHVAPRLKIPTSSPILSSMAQNPLLVGLEASREARPFVIYIFGVTGDLTRKKLMPALFSLFLAGTTDFKVVGFARRPWGTDGLRERAREMLSDFADAGTEQIDAFLSRLEYLQSTFQDPEGFRKIDDFAEGYQNRIYYLSTPPSAYEDIIANLGSYGLAQREEGFTRIVVEKPFGRDFASAQALNRALAEHFREDQIYRIDHYLGKETVQNILALRFGNGIFEPIWNNNYIDHIQITVGEKIGVGTRGTYYESAGALRDMVQNHIFQLLSLTTMEPPNDLAPDSIRGEKVKVLKALRPITYRGIAENTVRGQYSAGIVDGQEVPGYREEEGVSADSQTETFVALRLFIDTWRWAGVPIFVRSGKRLLRKVSEISVHFKEPPHEIFRNRHPAMNRNALIIRIQPQEGATLNMNAKIPGYTTDMRPVNMDFAYGSAFGGHTLEAYERLIFDAIIGDSTLYTRRDEVETSWAFITRILEGWKLTYEPLPQYRPASSGPDEAKDLIASVGRRWRKL